MTETMTQPNELLAKLLAAEDISVRFNSNIESLAAFDLKSRVLHVSKLNNEMQKFMPALLVHEVGHALYTNMPEDVKPIDIFNNCRFLQNVWNAIEDGYVDRRTGKKYPGIKQNRTELFDEIFKNDEKETCRAIELLNLLIANCKGFPIGRFFDWPEYLTPEHRELFNQAIFLNEPELMARISFSNLVKEAISTYGDATDIGDGDIILSPDDDGAPNGSQQSDTDKMGGGKGQSKKLTDEQLDEILQNNKNDVLNDDTINEKLKDQDINNREKFSGNTWIEEDIGNLRFPSQQDILELADIFDIFESRDSDRAAYSDYGYPKFLDIHPVFSELKHNFTKVNKDAKSTAQKLFSGFIKQVKAFNFASTGFRKTGTLNPTKASLYQIQDDIFISRNIQPNQQNHAYIVLLDWSGSIRKDLGALIHRAFELTHFAALADIELEIWLYTDTSSNPASFASRLKDMSVDQQNRYKGLLFRQPKIIKILNTKKNKYELNDRLLNLFISAHLAISEIFKFCNKSTAATTITTKWKSMIAGHGVFNLFDSGIGSSRIKMREKYKSVKDQIMQIFELLSEEQRLDMFKSILKMTDLNGTTIFEAMSLAGKQLENMKAEVKNIILLTDGDDSIFYGVIGRFKSILGKTQLNCDTTFGITHGLPYNIIKKISNGEESLSYDGTQLSQKDFLSLYSERVAWGESNTKRVGLKLILKKLKKQGIHVNAIGWNLIPTLEMLNSHLFGKNSVNIITRTRGTLHRYTQMDNPFIKNIIKSLLNQH